jgi:3-oxoacyl-[acyl-carrier protein] reductase
MELKLAGKSVLITGASKGIGYACAMAFAGEGCAVHMASRSAENLAAAREQIRARHNVPVTTHVADLSNGDAARALVAACADVDILVNNAGAIPRGDVETIDEARWRGAWDLKVFGYINTTRAMLGIMKARRHGVIVNIIGMAAEMMTYDYAAGSMGNAAIVAFTRTVGSKSVDHGVRVVGISPPATRTERMETLLRAQAAKDLGDAGRWQELTRHMPFGRPCEPQEIADLTLFLASERAAYISGTVINVDAGASNRH